MHSTISNLLNIQSLVDHCYELAVNGEGELAQAGLQTALKEFYNTSYKPLPLAKDILEIAGRASCLISVYFDFQYAEHFYLRGEKKEARQWLCKAKQDARQRKLFINGKIKKMKKHYKDKMPLFSFFRVRVKQP